MFVKWKKGDAQADRDMELLKYFPETSEERKHIIERMRNKSREAENAEVRTGKYTGVTDMTQRTTERDEAGLDVESD